MDPPWIDVHSEITRYIDKLQENQEQIHGQYKVYLEKNKIIKVFGLDSFFYQTRLIDLETKHLNEQYLFICNRTYCDYYKLYGMVRTFFKDGLKLEPKKRNYPIYKDLEIFKLYDIQDILSLNHEIMDMLQKMYTVIRRQEEDLHKYTSSTYLNLDNFIENQKYNTSLLKKKVELYEKYFKSYHIYHMTFFSNLRDRIALFFRQAIHKLDETEPLYDKKTEYPRELSKKYEESKNEPITVVFHPVKESTKMPELQALLSVPEVEDATPSTLSIKELLSAVAEVKTPEIVIESIAEVFHQVRTEVAAVVGEVAAVVEEAQTEVAAVVAEAQTEVAAVVAEAQTEVAAIVEEAQTEVAAVVAEAQTEVAAVVAEAQSEVDAVVEEAQTEVAAVVAEAQSEVAAVVEEAQTEVASVVDEVAAVVEEAHAEVAAVVEEAHAEVAAVVAEAQTEVAAVVEEAQAEVAAVVDEVASVVDEVAAVVAEEPDLSFIETKKKKKSKK